MKEELPKHAMNQHRRDAFELMRRMSDRYTRSKEAPMATYFERDVMSSSMAWALEDLGWLSRSPGRNGRLTTITLTDVGLWILDAAKALTVKPNEVRP